MNGNSYPKLALNLSAKGKSSKIHAISLSIHMTSPTSGTEPLDLRFWYAETKEELAIVQESIRQLSKEEQPKEGLFDQIDLNTTVKTQLVYLKTPLASGKDTLCGLIVYEENTHSAMQLTVHLLRTIGGSKYEGRGITRQMLNRIVFIAKQKKLSEVYAAVPSSDEGSIRFFEKKPF